MTDFAKYIVAVAAELIGPPRPGGTKTEVRFGDGLTVNPQKGTFYDHQSETGGGVLDLITRQTGRKAREAIDWLREKGFHVDDDPAPPRPAARRQDAPRPAPADRPQDSDRAPDQPSEPEWKPARAWDYVDEAGQLLFQVVRMENGAIDAKTGKPQKTYRQRRPDPTARNGWSWKVQGTRLVPYRLPELIKAVRQRMTVFVVEGEKAADALAELGVPATCNPGGAGKWPEGFSEFFRNAEVVVLPDQDPQVVNRDGSPKFREDGSPVFPGQDHAELVTRSLLGVARSVRVLDLPDLPPKGDAVEWVQAGNDAERLYMLAEDAALGEQWVEARPWRKDAKPFQSRFRAIPWENLDEPGPEHEWLIRDVLTRRERSMVVGPSQAGKSFLVIDMAMAIARGVPFFGRRTLHGGVIYQAGEGALGIKKRLRAYRKKNGLTLKDRIPFVLLPEAVDLFGGDDPTNALIGEIRHWSTTFEVPLELIVIDTLSAATPGANENASEDMSRVLNRLSRIAKETGSHVMLVHHMNADGNKPRGHTSIFANLENVVTVVEAVGRSDVAGRQIRTATVRKQKDGEGGRKFEFVLEEHELGRDFYDEPITSCTIMPPEGSGTTDEGDARARRLTDRDELFLRALNEALLDNGVEPPPGLKLPKSIRRVVDARWVRLRYEALTPDTEDDPQKRDQNIRQDMSRISGRLMRSGHIGRENPWIWIAREAALRDDDDPLGGW